MTDLRHASRREAGPADPAPRARARWVVAIAAVGVTAAVVAGMLLRAGSISTAGAAPAQEPAPPSWAWASPPAPGDDDLPAWEQRVRDVLPAAAGALGWTADLEASTAALRFPGDCLSWSSGSSGSGPSPCLEHGVDYDVVLVAAQPAGRRWEAHGTIPFPRTLMHTGGYDACPVDGADGWPEPVAVDGPQDQRGICDGPDGTLSARTTGSRTRYAVDLGIGAVVVPLGTSPSARPAQVARASALVSQPLESAAVVLNRDVAATPSLPD